MSARASNIECMFDGADEAGLVATIEDATRAEAAAGALRSAAIGELVSRRVADEADDPRAWWACDVWDSAAAEIGAAMNISHRKASGQMRIAETLRDHLPGVSELYRRGGSAAESSRRSRGVPGWSPMTRCGHRSTPRWRSARKSGGRSRKTNSSLQWTPWRTASIPRRRSPDARWRVARDFTVGDFEDETGLTSRWGKLLAPDAAVLDKKVSAMAATVCENDPRTIGERRADALGRWPTATITCRVRAHRRHARSPPISRRRSPPW